MWPFLLSLINTGALSKRKKYKGLLALISCCPCYYGIYLPFLSRELQVQSWPQQTSENMHENQKNKIRWLGTEVTTSTRCSIRRRKSWSCCWIRRDWKGKTIFSKSVMTNLTNHFSLKIMRTWTVMLLPVDQHLKSKISPKFLQLYLDELAGFQLISKIIFPQWMHQFPSLHHRPYLCQQIPLVKFLQPLALFLQISKLLQPSQTHLGCTVSTCKFQPLTLRKWMISTMFVMLPTSPCHKPQLQRVSCHTSTRITSPHSSVWLITASSVGFTTKSSKDLDDLVQQVLLAEDFNCEDLWNFRAAQEFKKLDGHMNQPSNLSATDGWVEGSIKIHLPCTRVKVKLEEEAPEFLVEPVYYCCLTQVLVSSFQEPTTKLFHYIAFKLFWKPTADSPLKRVLSEVYNSDAMIAEHEKIQSQPNEPGCNLEKAVAAALIFSDSTHLTNFGVASLWLWPGYVYGEIRQNMNVQNLHRSQHIILYTCNL